MKQDEGFSGFSDILKQRQTTGNTNKQTKPPAYEWQELALRVIKELNVPAFKRNSVFKICKDNTKVYVEQCLNDTKELCKTGEKWKYFFKVAAGKSTIKPEENIG